MALFGPPGSRKSFAYLQNSEMFACIAMRTFLYMILEPSRMTLAYGMAKAQNRAYDTHKIKLFKQPLSAGLEVTLLTATPELSVTEEGYWYQSKCDVPVSEYYYGTMDR